MPPRSSAIRRLLGIEQFELLAQSFTKHSTNGPQATLGTWHVAGAILIALIPALSFFIAPIFPKIDVATLLVGLTTCFAIIYRIRSNIPFGSVAEWLHSLKLTHFGFALGCIPLVFLLLLDPDAFVRMSFDAPAAKGAGTAPVPTTQQLIGFILGVAAWAALTEEFIYRGMLISVIRRWKRIRSPLVRDWVAISISALLFGFAHFATWGPTLSLALVGLGIGFGVAYIAAGELVLPLVAYHLIFDALSLTAAVFYK